MLLELRVRQPAGLAQDLVVDGDLADVVQQRRRRRSRRRSSSGSPISSASSSEYAVTRWVWLPVYSSRISTAWASAVTVWRNSASWRSTNCCRSSPSATAAAQRVGQVQVGLGERRVVRPAVEVQHADLAIRGAEHGADGRIHLPADGARRPRVRCLRAILEQERLPRAERDVASVFPGGARTPPRRTCPRSTAPPVARSRRPAGTRRRGGP